MVDETEFDIMDADHESRLSDIDTDEPYCMNCGEDTNLSYLKSYAGGEIFECKECKHQFVWPD